MKNSFLYTNAKGKRTLTPVAWSLTGIVSVLILVTGFSLINAQTNRSRVQATAQPITAATVTPTLPGINAQSLTNSGCPTDPSQWRFADVSPDTNYKRIEPPCVYDGIGRLVEWIALSSTYGYDIYEAAKLLEYQKIVVPVQTFKELVIRSYQGEQLSTIAPTYTLMDSGLRWWEVGPDKQVLVDTFVLQGCYRTYDVVGNEKQYIWAGYQAYTYEAICQLSVDAKSRGWYIANYGENVIASGEVNGGGRALLYVAYDSFAGEWELIGLEADRPSPGREQLTSEYSLMQQWYGAPIWNNDWFKEFGFLATPLPDGWEQRNTSADFEALMKKYEAN